MCIYLIYIVLKPSVAYREHYDMCYGISGKGTDQGCGIAVQLPEQRGDQDTDSSRYHEIYDALNSKAYLFKVINKGHHREGGAYHAVKQQIDICSHGSGRKERQEIRGYGTEAGITHGIDHDIYDQVDDQSAEGRYGKAYGAFFQCFLKHVPYSPFLSL